MPEDIKHRLRILMQKYLDRTCTSEERDELVRLISRTSGPEEVNDLWQNVWSETDGSVHYDELNWDDLQKSHISNQKPPIRVVGIKVLKWSVAAAVILCVYFAVDWLMKGEDLIFYQTGFGERLEVVLDDGTTVNLNADSKLSWNPDYVDNGVREISLEGEAFFDVAHVDNHGNPLINDDGTKKRMPFVVKTSDLTIKVLGTAFNTIQRRGKTEIFLEKGNVEVSLNRINKHLDGKQGASRVAKNSKSMDASDSTDIIRMQPGDWVSFSSDNNVLEQKEVEKPKALSEWKDGTLSYQDVEFRKMLQSLEDLYGKMFEVEDSKLLDRRVNVGVPYENWETVKEMMETMLSIELIENENNKIQIKNGKDIN